MTHGVLTAAPPVMPPVAPSGALGDVAADQRSDRDAMLAVGRIGWYAGCLTMPALALRVAGLSVSDVCFGVAALAAAASMHRWRPDRTRWAWTMAAALAVCAAVLAQPAAAQANASLAVALRLAFIWVVWRWTAVALLGRSTHLRRSLTLFLIGCAASSAVALAQAALGVTVLGTSLFGTDNRATGLAAHANDQGGQLAVAFAIGLALWTHRDRAQVLVPASVALISVGLVLSGSVTGMLAAAVGAAFVLIRGARLQRKIQLGLLIGAGTYLAAVVQTRLDTVSPWERLSATTGGRDATNTLEIRLETMRYAWASIGANPWVGVGLDDSSGGTYDGVARTHNIVLLFWYQGGILLLAALLVALGAVGALLLRAVDQTSPLRAALLAGMVSGLAFACTAPLTFNRYFWFPAALAFALAAVYSREVGARASTAQAGGVPMPRHSWGKR